MGSSDPLSYVLAVSPDVLFPNNFIFRTGLLTSR